MIDASDDPEARPALYYLIAETAGAQTLTASANLYGGRRQGSHRGGRRHRQTGLSLPAGALAASPTNLSFTVTAARAHRFDAGGLDQRRRRSSRLQIFAFRASLPAMTRRVPLRRTPAIPAPRISMTGMRQIFA